MADKTTWQLLQEEFSCWSTDGLDEKLASGFASVSGRKVESLEKMRSGLGVPFYLDPKTDAVPDRIFMLTEGRQGRMVYIAYRCVAECNSLVMGMPLIFQEESYHNLYGKSGLLFYCMVCGNPWQKFVEASASKDQLKIQV